METHSNERRERTDDEEDRPPTGSLQAEDDDLTDRDFPWEDGDAADRRRDPLRR